MSAMRRACTSVVKATESSCEAPKVERPVKAYKVQARMESRAVVRHYVHHGLSSAICLASSYWTSEPFLLVSQVMFIMEAESL